MNSVLLVLLGEIMCNDHCYTVSIKSVYRLKYIYFLSGYETNI